MKMYTKGLSVALLFMLPIMTVAADSLFPLNNNEIRQIRGKVETIRKARESSSHIATTNTAITIRTRSLIDEASPPTVRAVSGFISTVFFKGENDAIWPIERIVSASDAIKVHFEEKSGRESFNIAATKPYQQTNISVYLKGKVEPITLFVNTNAKPSSGFDAQLTILVPGMLEGGIPKTFSNFTSLSDKLSQVLNYKPSGDWQELRLADYKGSMIKIWHQGNTALVRTYGAELFAPEYINEASNADGSVHAYEFDEIPMSITISMQGGLRTFSLNADEMSQAISGGQDA